MDFKSTAKSLVAAFEREEVEYALIGGFALGLWGVQRGTVDMDFLVRRDDLDKLDAIMGALGYELRYRSENVSQFISPLKVFGEVDFIHAFRDASLAMLLRSETKVLFGNGLSLNVLQPEDLIGLKLQALVNDPRRAALDLNDIEMLMKVRGETMAWGLIEEYFEIFERTEQFAELAGKYRHAD